LLEVVLFLLLTATDLRRTWGVRRAAGCVRTASTVPAPEFFQKISEAIPFFQFSKFHFSNPDLDLEISADFIFETGVNGRPQFAREPSAGSDLKKGWAGGSTNEI
jgi:hypothetical protein